MTAKELAAYIRIKTRTNANNFSDADIKALLAVHFDDLALDILQLDEDYFGDPETRNLEADVREYPFNSDILGKIKLVEAKLDGTNWIRLFPLDLRRYTRTTNETAITYNFSNIEGEAKYDIFRRSLWIYSGSVTAVTSGLKVWTYSYPAHVTDLTSEVDMSVDPTNLTRGFPRALHRVLGDLVVIDYKESQVKPIPLTQTELNVEMRKQKALNAMRGQSQEEEIIADLPPASERWNNGQNL